MGIENFISPAAAAGQRKDKRARVLLVGKLQTQFGEIEARLRDISRKGALIECNQAPPVGSEVLFSRGSTTVPARVAWTGGNRVGLEFQFMIDENEVLVQLRKPGGSGGAVQQRFRRPGLHEDLSEKERKLARAWGVSVGITLPETDF